MLRKLILTKDGSHSIYIPEMNVAYHSVHGAIQESLHVFIEAGLNKCLNNTSGSLYIFEMGFGTGLNALLTLIAMKNRQQPVHYTSVELFPLSVDETSSLNYCRQLNRPELQPLFEMMHTCEWNKSIAINKQFTLHKLNENFFNLATTQFFNLIYYDAFAPSAQPELWTEEIFKKLHGMMTDDGTLVTYCSKGDVRRAMQAAGFIVEKISGPPGKREMLRARIML